jgi:hypothetical protein
VSQLAVTVGANASGNPRLDMVVLEVLDQQHTGSSNTLQLRVVPGTATVAATLDNRTGAAAVPASCIHLADILVANGAATIVTADIRDRRRFPLPGVVPPILTAVDMVGFQVQLGMQHASGTVAAAGATDSHQAACAMLLPRRIVGATRIRWRYSQFTTANVANYNIGVYDATGRKIVETGAVAFTGAANAIVEASLTITATTFEAGWYYVVVGLAASTAASVVSSNIALMNVTASSPGCMARNVALRSTTGATTLPNTLLALTDVATTAAATTIPGVPVVMLSVG